MNSEVKEALKVLEDAGMDIKQAMGMPDPKVEGCVLVGLMDIKQAFLVFTSKHWTHDDGFGMDFEDVEDWEKAKAMLEKWNEKWNAGLDGEALY